MAVKKSELYSSLWASCDDLRGSMDASQYQDYVLVLLFVKYVSDRYAGQPYAAITVPPGARFADMVALKGKPDIGDQINKKILGKGNPNASLYQGKGASAGASVALGKRTWPVCGDPGDGMERGRRRLGTVSDDGGALLAAATSSLPAAWRKTEHSRRSSEAAPRAG